MHALPTGVVDSVNNATAAVNKMPIIGPLSQMIGAVPATADQLDSQISAVDHDYDAARGPNAGIDWGRGAGNLIGSIPLAASAATLAPAGAAGLTRAVVQGGILGALNSGATQTVDTSANPDFAAEKAKQVALGTLLGGGLSGATNTVGKVISPYVRPALQTLIDSGITNMTPGQIIGGAAQRIEQGMTSIPVLGDMIKSAQRRAFQSFDTAAINRSLAPIGDQLPDGTTGRDAISYASDSLGNAYDNVLNKIGSVPVDNQLLGDLSNLHGMVGNVKQAAQDQFSSIIDNEILGRVDQYGNLTGDSLKAAESNLGSVAKGLMRSGNYDDSTVGTAVSQAQASLRQFLQRASPQNADALAAVNSGYANLMRTQRASSYLGADGGIFSPDQLQSAVKALDPTKNNRGFATGTALMQDLSEAGKDVMGSKVPDSGTPFRNAVMTGLAAVAGHSALPPSAMPVAAATGAAAAAAAVPYTSWGQRMGQMLLTARPEAAQAVGDFVKRISPYAALLTGPGAAGAAAGASAAP